MLRPRWLLGTVLVVAIVSGCISAGFWQLRRLDERRQTNAQIRARAGEQIPLPPAGFAEGADVDELIYRRVTTTGTYDREHEVLVRFRSRRGLPGYEVVTPLVSEAGTLLVDRGWVPLEIGDRWTVPSPSAPPGEVTVEGLLSPPEHGSPRIMRPERDDQPVVVGTIAIPALEAVVGHKDLYAVHLLAAAAPDAPYPAPVDPPDLGEGPHRDYAVQWFLFAAVGVVGWITLLFRRGPLRRARKASAE